VDHVNWCGASLQVFTGHQHNFEKNLLKCDWSPDGTKVRSNHQMLL